MKSLIVVLLLIPSVCFGQILFEENFDALPDWSPVQTNAVVSCRSGDTCSTSIPTGFYDYRVAANASCSNLDGQHNSLNINSLHPRGTGKSLQVWNEPCPSSGGSWGSDGILGIAFTPQREVYIKWWQLFQSDWTWWTGDSPMQKFIHLTHYDESTPSTIWDFFGTVQNKPRYVGGYAKYGKGTYRTQLYMLPSYLMNPRANPTDSTTNDYLGAPPLDWSNTGAPGDGQWHSMQWHVKLNSAGGVADGEAHFWLDGRLVHSQTNIPWAATGDNPDDWKWNHVWLGGNNYNYYTGDEQWYAVDDVVVSTTYIPEDYIVGGAPPAEIDMIPPTTFAGKAPGRYISSQSVSLTTEQGATTKYCLTPGCTPTLTYSAPVTVLKNLAYQVLRYSSVDESSNTETTKELIFKKQKRK